MMPLNFKFILIALFYFAALSPDVSYAQKSEQTIKIGMSAAFTGPSKDIGNDLYNGAISYFNEVNANGGINGNIIELINYDDGYNPIPALQNTLKLINEDKVFLLFSYVGTPTVTRVLPLLKLYDYENIYLFFPLTGAQPHREAPYNEFIFNLRASYREETQGLVDNFTGIGRNRIAVFYQSDAYGRSGWDGVRRALAKKNLKIVSEATYKRGSSFHESFERQADLLKASNPDAIISVGSYEACAGLIRDLRNDNFIIPVANLSFVGSDSLLKLLDEESKKTNKNYTVNLINSEVVPNFNDLSIPVVTEYRNLNEKHNFIGFEGFLNAKLIVEIIKRMEGNISRKHIKTTVESIDNYDIGLDQKISFSPTKHHALDSVYFNTVKNGEWVSINSWDVWKK